MGYGSAFLKSIVERASDHLSSSSLITCEVGAAGAEGGLGNEIGGDVMDDSSGM